MPSMLEEGKDESSKSLGGDEQAESETVLEGKETPIADTDDVDSDENNSSDNSYGLALLFGDAKMGDNNDAEDTDVEQAGDDEEGEQTCETEQQDSFEAPVLVEPAVLELFAEFEHLINDVE